MERTEWCIYIYILNFNDQNEYLVWVHGKIMTILLEKSTNLYVIQWQVRVKHIGLLPLKSKWVKIFKFGLDFSLLEDDFCTLATFWKVGS